MDEADKVLLRCASEMAHEQRYGAARRVLGRPNVVAFIGHAECIDCRLGGLTADESQIAHATINVQSPRE